MKDDELAREQMWLTSVWMSRVTTNEEININLVYQDSYKCKKKISRLVNFPLNKERYDI